MGFGITNELPALGRVGMVAARPAATAASALPPGTYDRNVPQTDQTNHAARRLLITAGPTHEPIDAVRYIGNRSSGRLGVQLADRAAARGWSVTLLLGPTSLSPNHSDVRTVRFRTTAELQDALAEEFERCDVLVMTAAVADYRPKTRELGGKIKRASQGLSLELEATPDLLAAVSKARLPGQFVVGFALEPRDRMIESARDKLQRKSLDLIVANPLETMDAPTIEAALLAPDEPAPTRLAAMSKAVFADALLDEIERRLGSGNLRSPAMNTPNATSGTRRK